MVIRIWSIYISVIDVLIEGLLELLVIKGLEGVEGFECVEGFEDVAFEGAEGQPKYSFLYPIGKFLIRQDTNHSAE